MDKADFTFIVTALCYLALSLLCRSGLLDTMVLDVAGVFLCGILMKCKAGGKFRLNYQYL